MRLGPPPKRRLPHSEIDPPKEYSAPVGEIVLRWTRLEYQLGVIIRVIAKLGKADQRQLILNQRAQSLCRILRVLVPGIVSPDKIATELTEFAMEVEKSAIGGTLMCIVSMAIGLTSRLSRLGFA